MGAAAAAGGVLAAGTSEAKRAVAPIGYRGSYLERFRSTHTSVAAGDSTRRARHPLVQEKRRMRRKFYARH